MEEFKSNSHDKKVQLTFTASSPVITLDDQIKSQFTHAITDSIRINFHLCLAFYSMCLSSVLVMYYSEKIIPMVSIATSLIFLMSMLVMCYQLSTQCKWKKYGSRHLYHLSLDSSIMSLLGLFSGLIGTFIMISGLTPMPEFFFASVFLLLSSAVINCFQVRVWGETTQTIFAFCLLIPILVASCGLSAELLFRMGINIPGLHASNAIIWIIAVAAINTITLLGNHIYVAKSNAKTRDYFCVIPPNLSLLCRYG